MMDIILINGYRVARPVLPIGIGYLAQAIGDAGFDYDVCDVNLQSASQILAVVEQAKPRYLGCGTMSYEVEKNYQLLESIHEVSPDTIIILGGPHAIAAGKKIFHDCPAINMIIQGEGEESIVMVLRGAPPNKIPGALARDSNAPEIPRKLPDVGKIAFPRYHKFDLSKYGDTICISSSRGCLYKCSFCGAPKFLGNVWRAFETSKMIAEFEYWRAKGYKQFYFSDSLFLLNRKRVIDFCDYVVKTGYKDVGFAADGVRADHLTIECLHHMKMANFTSITVGVESVNNATLKFLNKGVSFSQIDAAISAADSMGFDISMYLILGTPGETFDEAINSIRYPMKYKNVVFAVYSKLMPILGTPYYDYAAEHNLLPDDVGCYPKMEAFGANPRNNSHSPVEAIWEALTPEVRRVSEFLALRAQLRKGLAAFGLFSCDVKWLNKLTSVALKPFMNFSFNAAVGVAKFIDLGKLLKKFKYSCR